MLITYLKIHQLNKVEGAATVLVIYFLSALLFLPSVNFNFQLAEIFPWALIFVAFATHRYSRHHISIVYFFLVFALISAVHLGDLFNQQVIRSLAAYLNSSMIFISILMLSRVMRKILVRMACVVFAVLTVVGLLQFFGFAEILQKPLSLLMSRGSSGVYGGGRGVALLSSEPSRAAYEYLFISLIFRQCVKAGYRRVAVDVLTLLFLAFVIRSSLGVLLNILALAIIYPRPFLFGAVLVLPLTATIPFDLPESRALRLVLSLTQAGSLANTWDVLVFQSGFRIPSVLASMAYGFEHPIGGGLGQWQTTSIEALSASGMNPSAIGYFVHTHGGHWASVRPTSYFANLMLDTGVIGTAIFISILGAAVRTSALLAKLDRDTISVGLIFLFYFIFTGAVGNPIPWVVFGLFLSGFFVLGRSN